MFDKFLDYEMLKLLFMEGKQSSEMKNMLIEGIFSPQIKDYGNQSKN